MADPISKLLGPPQLQASPETRNSNKTHNPPRTRDPFMDLMLAEFNTSKVTPKPLKGLTENFSPTYLSTGSPCVDFFFQVVPNTPPESLTDRLDLAWRHNPLTTLKLVCNLRGVRNTGKTDKEGFYSAALWLHNHHPKTLACNLKYMVDFGYFKDLPELLFRLLQGPDVRKSDGRKKVGKKYEWLTNKRGKKYYRRIGETPSLTRKGSRSFNGEEKKSVGVKKSVEFKKKAKEMEKKSKAERIEKLRASREVTREKRLLAESMKVKGAVEKARKNRNDKKVNLAKKGIERYIRDPDYRFLHDCVSEVFAKRLVSDLQALKAGEVGKIGLAAKWCPSLDSSYDKAILICESIAKRVFPRDSYPEYEGVEEAHYAYRVRDRLRKEVLVPLRQALELPETYMSLNEWNNLPYSRVASVAMTKYKKHFKKHDEERFKEYLGQVKRGEAKIAAGALLPHEIIKEVVSANFIIDDDEESDDDSDEDMKEVAELQWQRMVDDLLKKGKLKNCIAVCDVSGSMTGVPMEVCVSLGLLISELSEEPWKGKVLTFSQNPQLHTVVGNDLKSKTEFIQRMEWGMNTDFQKVFDRILDVAVIGKLKKEQVIKKIFVFSDMEFDAASARRSYYSSYYSSTCRYQTGWDTDYEVIQKKFAERGYDVPQIIFWNLRDSKATPVTADQKGVALVSGFSKNMVTLFLDEDEDLKLPGPEHAMNTAISGPEFSNLMVFD